MPSVRHASRAFSVQISELRSAGFQTTPTVRRRGQSRCGLAQDLLYRLESPHAREPTRLVRRVHPPDADPADRIGHAAEHVQGAAVLLAFATHCRESVLIVITIW